MGRCIEMPSNESNRLDQVVVATIKRKKKHGTGFPLSQWRLCLTNLITADRDGYKHGHYFYKQK